MSDSSKVFDRVTVLVSTIGVVLMATMFVLVVGRPGVSGGEPSRTLPEVELSEFAITGDLTVPVGEMAVRVTNAGSVPHNFTVEGGPATSELNPGEATTLNLGELAAGSYRLFCSVPGHQAAGMEATLTVGDGTAQAEGHNVGDTVDYAAMDAAMTESILAFPATTEGKGNQVIEPAILADGTKQYEITVAITPWEVAPGKVVDAWTYNGQAPGPALRLDDGDRVSVIIHNQLPMGTDVHFHGIKLENAMDGVAPLTQPLIASGESFAYEFVAEGPAVAMYHAHHHAQLQVPNGLFGTIIIGDTQLPTGRTIGGIEVPTDLEIAAELPMVLNDAGVIVYSINGKSFPATDPLVV
ncbi:MAG: multicopper oxidase domain-containing protein [Acidimicrobiia bacterium]|nr:multicopper oxidase domain-containing protein [Acidimicrobiia bacterium]